MHFLSDELDHYVTDHSENEPELLAQLNKETHQKILQPRMLSGHFQGRVLSMISKIIRPINVLEIGTYTGYATLCLAEGLTENGKVDTIDINEELIDFQRKFFDKSPWGPQILQHLGPALEIIPKLNKKYDLVFIDADKDNYINYFNAIIPIMNTGGIILSDNVLWSGKVLEPAVEKDFDTQVLQELNDLVAKDSRCEKVLLPLRDGLMMVRVKK
jgi:predicted O-methyltransferase YrrM